MLTDEVIEKVTERLINRIEQGNTYVVEQIGKSIKKVGTLTPSKAHELEQILKYGGDYDKIVKKLAQITKLNVRDIKKIFEEVAKSDYQFSKQFYEYRNKKFIPYEENETLKRQVNILTKELVDNYISKTKSIGFSLRDNKGNVIFRTLGETYQDVIDKAIINVAQGKTTFQQEMYQTIKDIGASGLKTIEYESGRTMRFDSYFRMLVKDSVRQLHNEEQQIFGKEFDADGVEISVHLNPAPDHELVQGRQFSNEEFEKFQNDKDAVSYDGIHFPAIAEETGHDRRAISQYNCYHYTFAIVLGVSDPEYSNEELQQIIDDNNKGFEYEGKHYTMYEGTQLQRKLETEIRKQKDIQIIAKASDNEELIAETQGNITTLTNKYKELSQVSGLPTKMDRMRVSGYKRVKIEPLKNQAEIDYARKNNAIWHSTENLEEIIKEDKIIAPSLSAGKKITRQVKYGSQFIEFKPEILENVDKETLLYKGDGGNKFTKEVGQFDNLMQMLKDNPKIYNELKFNKDLEFLKYIKKVYIREDEPQEIIKLLKENNIEYELYKDDKIRMFKKKK